MKGLAFLVQDRVDMSPWYEIAEWRSWMKLVKSNCVDRIELRQIYIVEFLTTGSFGAFRILPRRNFRTNDLEAPSIR